MLVYQRVFSILIISQPLKIACAEDALRCREHRQLGERDDQVTCRICYLEDPRNELLRNIGFSYPINGMTLGIRDL